MTSLLEVGAEAVCSALYGMPFSKFLGERPEPSYGNAVAWFRLHQNGDEDVPARVDPKQVMVAVRQNPDLTQIEVTVGWLNVSSREVLKGEQTFIISARDGEAACRVATEEVLLRVLDIYQQVLDQTGVAGDNLTEALKPYNDDDTDDESEEDEDDE